ncbi:hypothetical protein QFC21_007364 [Naganishia friedmannii]|uniref:Uncharacterized protein n=2 Tax=Naganishia friedmannii TaxID=89922 RepID=A0ACC2UUY0_9TREE|nr:hypothetical protein QFC21_007364 [Naganishia friedmannii]
MRIAMRKALILLKERHHFDFSGFNDVYKLFLVGGEPEKRSGKAIEVCNRFFANVLPFKDYLGLKTEGTNLKPLKVICDCAERLNLTPEKIREYAFRIRDLRVAEKPNTQAVSQNVTGDDLNKLKAELQLCEANLSSKRKHDLGIQNNLPATKRNKGTTVPTSNPEQSEPGPCEPIGQEAELRNNKQTPKDADKLYRYAIPRPQAGSQFVRFVSWMNSAFVHGHAGRGRFRLDDQEGGGEIRVSRLVSFFDALQRQEPGYFQSWIVLPPMADGRLRGEKWTQVSGLMNQGHSSFEDLGVVFLKKDSDNVTRNLWVIARFSLFCQFTDAIFDNRSDGSAVLVLNNMELGNYPFEERALTELCARQPDFGIKLQTLIATEDPEQDYIPSHAEVFMRYPVMLDEHTKMELPMLEDFYETLQEQLPLPNMQEESCDRALSEIQSHLPLVYGSQDAVSQVMDPHSAILGGLSRRKVLHNAPGQLLPWKDNDPRCMTSTGMSVKSRVDQAEWLQRLATNVFGPKRCVGVAGSLRMETSAVAGSLFWSVILRGERLVVLHLPEKAGLDKGEQTFKFIQRPGDLLILPAGMKYSWYNVRTTISDEGCFYTVDGFSPKYSVPIDCFQAMLKRPTSHARAPEEIIAYWVIVCQGYRLYARFDQDDAGGDELQAFIRFLFSSPFAYIAPFTYGRLDQYDLRMVVQVLGWTAPMAALLLRRLANQLERGSLPQDWTDDSITAVQADEDLMTSDEEDVSEDEGSTGTDFNIDWDDESESGSVDDMKAGENDPVGLGVTERLEDTQVDDNPTQANIGTNANSAEEDSEDWGLGYDSQAIAAASMLEGEMTK